VTGALYALMFHFATLPSSCCSLVFCSVIGLARLSLKEDDDDDDVFLFCMSIEYMPCDLDDQFSSQ